MTATVITYWTAPDSLKTVHRTVFAALPPLSMSMVTRVFVLFFRFYEQKDFRKIAAELFDAT